MAEQTSRPFLGIYFECCRIYSRVYRNAQGTAYQGRCPLCLRPVRLVIGPNGTSSRLFVAR